MIVSILRRSNGSTVDWTFCGGVSCVVDLRRADVTFPSILGLEEADRSLCLGACTAAAVASDVLTWHEEKSLGSLGATRS